MRLKRFVFDISVGDRHKDVMFSDVGTSVSISTTTSHVSSTPRPAITTSAMSTLSPMTSTQPMSTTSMPDSALKYDLFTR